MAIAFASTASASPSAAATNACANYIYRYPSSSSSSILSFHLPRKPKPQLFTKGSPPSRMLLPRVKAEPNEVSFIEWSLFGDLISFLLDKALRSAFASKVAVVGSSANKTKSDKVAIVSVEDTKPSSDEQSSSKVLEVEEEESISQFVTQVESLVKLVDSRDIVELQLKQLDCEVTIRKAMLQPQAPAEVAMMYSPSSPIVAPITEASTSTFTPAPSTLTLSTSPASVNSAKSSHIPLKCPMAGTFYRSPAPGEPPFVKVGDKVKKGQVLCIIEAMKLMNEIVFVIKLITSHQEDGDNVAQNTFLIHVRDLLFEHNKADQSGTIADILVEDGKPISVDTPIFVIEP